MAQRATLRYCAVPVPDPRCLCRQLPPDHLRQVAHPAGGARARRAARLALRATAPTLAGPCADARDAALAPGRAQVVEHASAALFFDDDVLLLDNPFAHFESAQYDFRHQTERGAGCLAKPNGGLLFVRATAPGKALLRNMVAQKDAIEASGDKLDQEYVAGAADAAGAARCALPRGRFVGHCPYAQHGSAPLRGVITYHAHCCGARDSKMALLARVAAARVATPDARFADVDRVPLPGFTLLNDSCYYPYWSDARALRRAWAKVDAALEWPAAGGGARALQGRGAGDILR
jgi:hypothetical protein